MGVATLAGCPLRPDMTSARTGLDSELSTTGTCSEYESPELARTLTMCQTEEEVLRVLTDLGLSREQASMALRLALLTQAAAGRRATEATLHAGPEQHGARQQGFTFQTGSKAPAGVSVDTSLCHFSPVLDGLPPRWKPAGPQSAFAFQAAVHDTINEGETPGPIGPGPSCEVSAKREASLSDWVPGKKRRNPPPGPRRAPGHGLDIERSGLGRACSLDEWMG
ncbi:hypothetical protein ACKKBF_B09195 [Auxenochlorella protothecoides x Auxenochlorella symbiontica]